MKRGEEEAMQHVQISDLTGIITILGFLGSIVIFLFKKIVIDPLKQAIDGLSRSVEGIKLTIEKRIDLLENRVDIVEDKTSRHDEQIKSIFTIFERR